MKYRWGKIVRSTKFCSTNQVVFNTLNTPHSHHQDDLPRQAEHHKDRDSGGRTQQGCSWPCGVIHSLKARRKHSCSIHCNTDFYNRREGVGSKTFWLSLCVQLLERLQQYCRRNRTPGSHSRTPHSWWSIRWRRPGQLGNVSQLDYEPVSLETVQLTAELRLSFLANVGGSKTLKDLPERGTGTSDLKKNRSGGLLMDNCRITMNGNAWKKKRIQFICLCNIQISNIYKYPTHLCGISHFFGGKKIN